MPIRVPLLPALTVGCTVLALASGSTQALAEPFNHGRFDALLKAHVSPDGWGDYPALRKDSAAELRGYIQQLATARPAQFASREEKIAFWINAYNAVCMQTLIDSKLPAEVPKARLFGQNIFTEETYKIAGRVRSLDEIEHKILRKRFADPRVHAALVCGASSCPRLRAEAYTGAGPNEQLDEEARRWIQSGKDKAGKRKNRLDRASNTFHASKIFSWFQEDFGGNDAGVLAFAARFATAEDAEHLRKNKVRVRYLPYSWKLNSK